MGTWAADALGAIGEGQTLFAFCIVKKDEKMSKEPRLGL